MKKVNFYSKWPAAGLAALVMLALMFSRVEPSSAGHSHPTATRTPTITPTRTLQACQITQIEFDRDRYMVGDRINVTLWLVDSRGQPLIGANVDVEVIRQALSAQANGAPIDLEDQSGSYVGAFEPDLAGEYTFIFTANDPTGSRFLPCTAQATRLVESPTPTATSTATATPTNTATATPTNTATATPTSTATVEPDEATLMVAPALLTTTLCSLEETSQIQVKGVSNLVSIELELRYNPRVIQVIDADPGQRGVQVGIEPALSGASILQNSVDTVSGRIRFAATLPSGSAINGASDLISIQWRPQRVSSSAITIEEATLLDGSGQAITATRQNGTFQVDFVPNCLTGVITLQGRGDHSGVVVAGGGNQVQTAADGYFAIIGEGNLSVTFPGYLAGQAELGAALQAAPAEGEAYRLGRLDLLAGDVNGDGQIDILDLAYIAGRYPSGDPTADLNHDGRVDILDLALVAGNYQQQGPLTGWQKE